MEFKKIIFLGMFLIGSLAHGVDFLGRDFSQLKLQNLLKKEASEILNGSRNLIDYCQSKTIPYPFCTLPTRVFVESLFLPDFVNHYIAYPAYCYLFKEVKAQFQGRRCFSPQLISSLNQTMKVLKVGAGAVTTGYFLYNKNYYYGLGSFLFAVNAYSDNGIDKIEQGVKDFIKKNQNDQISTLAGNQLLDFINTTFYRNIVTPSNA